MKLVKTIITVFVTAACICVCLVAVAFFLGSRCNETLGREEKLL